MALLSDSLYCLTRMIAGKTAAEDDEEEGKKIKTKIIQVK